MVDYENDHTKFWMWDAISKFSDVHKKKSLELKVWGVLCADVLNDEDHNLCEETGVKN